MKCYLLPVFLLVLFSCSSKEPPGPLSITQAPAKKAKTDSFSKLKKGRYNVALLLIEGTYNSELTAPMDIFHHTKFRDGIKAMNVFTVSNTYELVTTFEGLQIQPDFNFLDTLPSIDILIIPAAEHNLDSDLADEALVEFVRKTGTEAKYVCSHCDGAFLLAKSGLLAGHSSTTFPGDIAEYKSMFPELEVKEDVLFVHDGKFITSAGGAKSFEASLYLAQVLYGKEIADQLAKGMVIDWELEDLKYVQMAQ